MVTAEPARFYRIRHAIASLLGEVADPEIPNLSIVDLGMVIDIREENGHWSVDLAPTYSGCPAIDVIPLLVTQRLDEAGFREVDIRMVITPPWSTDWISETGRDRLGENGIAPPGGRASLLPDEGRPKSCPHCGSPDVEMVSRHGSTPCKAAYKCTACLEPFEYFKCF